MYSIMFRFKSICQDVYLMYRKHKLKSWINQNKNYYLKPWLKITIIKESNLLNPIKSSEPFYHLETPTVTLTVLDCKKQKDVLT